MTATKHALDTFWVADLDGRPEDPELDLSGPEPLDNEARFQSAHNEIDAFYDTHGLAPPFGGARNRERGASTILGMTSNVHLTKFAAWVTYVVRRWDGVIEYFTLRHQVGANKGKAIVTIPVINGWVILIRQYRVATCDWRTEFPRQFATNDLPRTIATRQIDKVCEDLDPEAKSALSLLGKKLSPVMMHRTIFIDEAVRLAHGMAQDSGHDTTCPEVWLIRMTIPGLDVKRIRGNRAMHPRFFRPEELLYSGEEGYPPLVEQGINDFLTEGALNKWLQYERMRTRQLR